MTEEQRAEIRARVEKALRGPWKVYPTPQRPTEAGLRQFGPDYVPFPEGHNQIGTAWDHPQIEGPAPVVTISVGPFSEPIYDVQIEDDDAAFIAAARQDVPDLLDALEAAEQDRDTLRAFLRRARPTMGLPGAPEALLRDVDEVIRDA